MNVADVASVRVGRSDRRARGDARSFLRACGTAGVSLALAVSGCSNPLGPIDSDAAARVPLERLRTIERFEKERFLAPPSPPTEVGEPSKPGSRLAQAERATLTIEEVRVKTLENNLDLRVALVDPTIAGEALRAEQAKFEAVFRPSAFFTEQDQPVFNVSDPAQQNIASVGLGVDIPLRTGGRASIDLSERLNETDNPFVVFNSSYDTSLQFSISQPLLRNAGRRASTYSIRVAEYEEQISQTRTKLEVIRQLTSADKAYWRLDAFRRALDVAQQQYELSDQLLQMARRQVDAGDAAEIEVIRAEAGVAQRLEAIINAENAVLRQQRELKRLINSPDLPLAGRTLIEPGSEPEAVRYDFDRGELVSRAINNRMEMLELELRLAADLSTIEYTKNQALPSLVLDYSYDIGGLGRTFRSSASQAWENNFESWSVSLRGEVPIGNQAAKARVQQAILARLQRLSSREARTLAIGQEVLDAVDRVEADWQRILAARQNVIASARAYEGELRLFDAGVSTSYNVNQFATDLADAQRAEILALADYQIAMVDLAFASGTVLGATKTDWSPSDPRDLPTPDGSEIDPTRAAWPIYPGAGYTDPDLSGDRGEAVGVP